MKQSSVAFASIAIAIVLGSAGDRVGACLQTNTIVLVNAARPGDIDAYERGAIGVVQPTYERRFLVAAYRRFVGAPSNSSKVAPPTVVAGLDDPGRTWLVAREAVLKTGKAPQSFTFVQWRRYQGYGSFLNCSDDALTVAARTLGERIQRYGLQSAVVLEWLHAQDTVFQNCTGLDDRPEDWRNPRVPGPVVLPPPVAAPADALVRADRAYQIAAAYFYATDYAEAETRFRAIAQDRSSPWQPFGRFLAARSLIRRAAIAMEAATQDERAAVLTQADADLTATEEDRAVPASLRASASGLRRLVALRLRPVARLHELAKRLTTGSDPSRPDLIDYTMLMDQLIGSADEYEYANIRDRERLIAGDDLTDWILALQGSGPGGWDRATARWSATHAVPWLVASMWRIPPDASLVPDLLRAAGAVGADSPAFASVAFLRVRLLIARGERGEAVRVLDTLPDRSSTSLPAEAINLFRALRLQAADTLAVWLHAAPRLSVASGDSFGATSVYENPSDTTFDVDAALALSESFPLSRLVEAASSDVLPARLRLMVASEAWTRAIQLRDDVAGEHLARLLRQMAPVLTSDMDRYLSGTGDERHYAGVLTLLRWPTFRNYMPLAEQGHDGEVPRFSGPAASLAGRVQKFWWCGFGPMRTWTAAGPYEETPFTRLPQVVYQSARIPPPAFLTETERARASREFEQLASFGTAPNYLANEAITWARTRPKDADVAEALARAVTSTHFGCADASTSSFSQRAFETLHRQYPNTEWAKKTKYWY